MKNSNQSFIGTIGYYLFILGFIFLVTACKDEPSKKGQSNRTSGTRNRVKRETGRSVDQRCGICFFEPCKE